MRRALPSDVVKVIEDQFLWANGDWRQHLAKKDEMRYYAPNVMPGILRLINQIPEELLVLDISTNARFTIALAALEAAAERASRNGLPFDWPQIVASGTTEQDDCLILVKNALAICPDTAPSTSTKGMIFIPDPRLRQDLLIDLGSAERAQNSGEWKRSQCSPVQL